MPNLIGSSFGHEHSTPPIGFAVEPVSKTKTHKYNVRIKVTRTHTHRWNRLIRITDDHASKTHKYNIINRVLVTKTHRFNSGGKVRSRLKTHKYNIIEKITKSKTHKYTVTILVSRTRTHKYNVIEKIIRIRTHKWNQDGRIYDDVVRTHKYNILNKITSTKTHKWNILTPKIITAELQYYKSTYSAGEGEGTLTPFVAPLRTPFDTSYAIGVSNIISGGGGEGVPDDCLGGAITASPVSDNVLHELFDVVTSTQSSNGSTEYRCIYVKNISSRSILDNPKIWIEQKNINNSPPDNIYLGVGTSEVGGEEQTIESQNNAPEGVSFSSAFEFANALTISTSLAAGEHKAIWIKRVITAGSPPSTNNNFILGFAGDTYASE